MQSESLFLLHSGNSLVRSLLPCLPCTYLSSQRDTWLRLLIFWGFSRFIPQACIHRKMCFREKFPSACPCFLPRYLSLFTHGTETSFRDMHFTHCCLILCSKRALASKPLCVTVYTHRLSDNLEMYSSRLTSWLHVESHAESAIIALHRVFQGRHDARCLWVSSF